MIEYTLIIAAILAIAAAVVIFNIVKGLVKAALIMAAVASIALAVAAFFVVSDANDLKENFQKGPNLLLVADGNEVMNGVKTAEGSARLVSEQQQKAYSQELEKKDYAAIKEENYKLIIADISAISSDETRQQLKAPEKNPKVIEAVFTELFSNPISLVKGYKEGKIVIYEETAAFRAIRMLPLAFVKSAAGKLLRSTEEMITNNATG